jgi:hypothetical protein
LNIGDSNTGTITVSAAITRSSATTLNLTTGNNEDIAINPGSLDAGGGSVTLTAGSGGQITSNASGTDVTGNLTVNGELAPGASAGLFVVGGDVTLSATDTLSIEVNGSTTAGTDYDQLNVTGTVDLGSATLSTSGTITSSAGQVVTIINNDDTDAVTGTFAGLAEGANVTINGVPFKISYVGGSGNDVVLSETQVSVSVSPASVTENGATNLDYTFTRVGSTGAPLTVNFTVSGGAVFSSDYTQTGAATFGVSAGTVTILAGSSTAVVTVDPTDDSTVEASETVVLTVTSGTGYEVGSPSAATGTITDNDTATFTIGDGTKNESDGTMTFTVSLSNPIDTTATINVTYTDVSATGSSGGVGAEFIRCLVLRSVRAYEKLSGSPNGTAAPPHHHEGPPIHPSPYPGPAPHFDGCTPSPAAMGEWRLSSHDAKIVQTRYVPTPPSRAGASVRWHANRVQAGPVGQGLVVVAEDAVVVLEDRPAFKIRHDGDVQGIPAAIDRPRQEQIVVHRLARREALVSRFVVVQRDADLSQVVYALRPASGFSRSLDGRQHQADQDADDGDHHQEFHQGECRRTADRELGAIW